jgi:hypothetical protein
MHPAFSNIQFGPFATSYHRSAVDDSFREAFSTYLEKELLPQVDEPFDSTVGSLVSAFADEKYCGPNSLVKDIYKLKFSLLRVGSSDDVETEIRRNPKTGLFSPRRKFYPLFLWTAKRKADEVKFREAVHDIVASVFNGGSAPSACPRCAAELKLYYPSDLIDLSCSRGCFAYNFHFDPETREMRHGHFFSAPWLK